jgi:hypothetical protein
MDTTTSVVATGIVVTLGRWVEERDIPFKIFVGFGLMLLFLTVIQSANQKFAEQFALLIFVASLFYYAPAIARIATQK